MRDKRIQSIHFETNCSDLVDMTSQPSPRKLMCSKHYMKNLKMSLVHNSWDRNGQTDSLVKEVKTRRCIFFHIDQTDRRKCSPTLGLVNWTVQKKIHIVYVYFIFLCYLRIFHVALILWRSQIFPKRK